MTIELRPHVRLLEPGLHANAELVRRRRSREGYLERLRVFARDHPDTVFSHGSAAVIHGLPLLDRIPETLHVVGEGGRVSFADRVVEHRPAFAAPVARVAELPVTDPVTTTIDFARRCALPQAVAIADHVLARRLVGESELRSAAERVPDAVERSAARRVTALADGRAESPLESVSRVTMSIAGAPPPELQVAFREGPGFRARVDFFWPKHGVIGEADGQAKYAHPAYRRERSGWEVLADQTRRHRRLEALGYRVIRWGWGSARRVDRLAELLAEAGLPVRDTPGLQVRSASGKLV